MLRNRQKGKIDVICGGFPCQDISGANPAGKGLQGQRSGLWREYKRIIKEVDPSFVIVENVPNKKHRWLERVLSDLHALGYDAEWHTIPATAIGSIQPRKRIWIIAYHREHGIYGCLSKPIQGEPILPGLENVRRIEDLRGRSDIPQPLIWRNGHGVPDWVDRLKAIGNAVVPQIPELIGKRIIAACSS